MTSIEIGAGEHPDPDYDVHPDVLAPALPQRLGLPSPGCEAVDDP